MEKTIKEELISFLNNNSDKVHNYVCGDDIEFTWVEHFENEERAWNFSVSFSNT